MKVIAISGKARSGKDTCAEFIKEELESKGQRVMVISLAKYIKLYMKNYLGWDGTSKTVADRDEMIYIGTTRIREQLNRPMFHVQRICEDIEIMSYKFDYAIIPDVRRVNEIEFLKAYFPRNVVPIRIYRDGYDSGLSKEQLESVTETDLDEYDIDSYTIWNRYDLETVKRLTINIVNKLDNRFNK